MKNSTYLTSVGVGEGAAVNHTRDEGRIIWSTVIIFMSTHNCKPSLH
jgi:hypothetical protein